jgi:hypothetical protein
MKAQFVQERLTYTGEQLRSHFAYRQYGFMGDCIIGFRGPCDIAKKHMVDIEDLRKGEDIYSEDMLHFIIEHHDTDLEKGILRQWLFAVIVREVLTSLKHDIVITREGSDLYDQDAKLSISIATVSPISTLIHFGINIISKNTPVKTRGLHDYGIEPISFAKEVMRRYADEYADLRRAHHKVNWVQ